VPKSLALTARLVLSHQKFKDSSWSNRSDVSSTGKKTEKKKKAFGVNYPTAAQHLPSIRDRS